MAALGSSRAPSTAGPVDTDELHRLVNKALSAGYSGRHALAASYFERAAALATQIHGDTLLAAHLKLQQASKLDMQANAHGVPADEATWELAKGVVPLLLRRIEANTLLPGRCTKEEVEYYRRYDDALCTRFQGPAISADEVTRLSFTVGLATALDAAFLMLSRLTQATALEAEPLSAAERGAGEAFVSHAVDLILPASRSLGTIYSDEEMRWIFERTVGSSVAANRHVYLNASCQVECSGDGGHASGTRSRGDSIERKARCSCQTKCSSPRS